MITSSKREQPIRVSSQSIVAASPTERAIKETASASKNPRPLKSLQRKLRREQRRLSRKMPKSRNRENARIYVARLYGRIANIRKDFLHKLSTRLARETQTVAVEQQSLSARGDCCAESQALCKRHSMSIEGAQKIFPSAANKTRYPYIQLESMINHHRFSLFIQKQEAVEQLCSGFSAYGFSRRSSIPDF